MTIRLRSHASVVMLTMAVIVAVGVFDPAATAQSNSPSANDTNGSSGLKTPWGAPDLQGIWSNAVVVPFERLPRYGTRQLKTDEEFRLSQEALIKKNQLAWVQGTD